MIKFLKVLFISMGLFMFSIGNILPNTDTKTIPIEYYTKPVEILDLAKSLSLNIIDLYKMKNIPVCSPIIGKEINRISSFYGYRIHPIFKHTSFHHGIDYSAKIGTTVRSTANGIVINNRRGKGYGKQIYIKHTNGYSTKYAHLNDIYVNVGDTVNVGDIIATVGSTGFSTGPHLHYEVRINNKPINPLDMYPQDITERNYMSYFDIVNEIINYSDNV